MAMGDSQYYGYALPSDYASIYRPPVQRPITPTRHPVQTFRAVARPIGTIRYANYYNPQLFGSIFFLLLLFYIIYLLLLVLLFLLLL